jgi:1-deoxy-D-xylulose-5-phosphate reductoisomerase
MKGVAILGSTGTIGEATLDVASRHPERFRVVALAAHSNHESLFAQIERHRPELAALADRAAAAKLSQRVASAGLPTRILAGPTACRPWRLSAVPRS